MFRDQGGNSMKFDLVKDARRKGPLIVAHRGVSGGNIPCNTIAAFDAALLQGADMIELDVSRSLDGTLYVFHPGMEWPQLLSEKRISELHDEEVAQLRFVNQDNTPTQFRVSRLEDVLRHLKGRCYINIDKFWEHVGPIMEVVRSLDMTDQILAKAAYSESVVRETMRLAPEVNFMLILYEKDDYTEDMLKLKEEGKLNYVGAELVFKRESSEFATQEYIGRMHDKGLVVWSNAIVYNYKDVLSAGHNDDVSVSHDPELGWGWLVDKGYDFIQTDWPMPLKMFMTVRK